MEAEFWHQRWEAGEIGFHQQQINQYLAEYWAHLRLSHGATVFVPLCGKSLDMNWLADQGYQVIGIELSRDAIEAFFIENGLQATRTDRAGLICWDSGAIRIFEGDFFSLRPEHLDGVEAVFDRAALVALPNWMRLDYAEKMRLLLKPSCKQLLITLVYDQPQMQGPPFAVPQSEVDTLYQPWCKIEQLDRVDMLRENPKFRERGVTRLDEEVFLLTVNG